MRRKKGKDQGQAWIAGTSDGDCRAFDKPLRRCGLEWILWLLGQSLSGVNGLAVFSGGLVEDLNLLCRDYVLYRVVETRLFLRLGLRLVASFFFFW